MDRQGRPPRPAKSPFQAERERGRKREQLSGFGVNAALVEEIHQRYEELEPDETVTDELDKRYFELLTLSEGLRKPMQNVIKKNRA